MRQILGATAVAMLVFAGAMTTAGANGAVLPAAPYDFDGDGFADLAVGVPDEAGGGAVNVLYGSHDGITAAGDQYWTQDSPGVKGVRQRGDKFGRAVASADFDRDGYADLAIGVPRDPGAAGVGRGAVNVLYGSPSGLTAAGDQLWTRQQFAVPGGGFFGDELLAAELTGDGYPDLAVGSSGAIVVMPGGAAGLRTNGAQVLEAPDTAAPAFSGFGGWLAAGDFDGDGHGDLVIGLPYTTIGSIILAGVLQVVYGGPTGLDVATVQTWSQDSPGILDEAEIGYAYDTDGQEMFGSRLAVGDFDGDGRDDLAMGVPEDAGSEGVVNVIYGSADGLTADGNQLWTTTGLSVPGEFDDSDSGGRFGAAVAGGDLNHDGFDDLAVGSPERNPSGPSRTEDDFGVVTVIYGSAAGLVATGSTSWSQDSANVPGSGETADRFGFQLQIAQIGHSASEDLIVGVPGESTGSARWAGAVNVLYGRTSGVSGGLAQYWHQNSSGVKGSAATEEWFGRYLGH